MQEVFVSLVAQAENKSVIFLKPVGQKVIVPVVVHNAEDIMINESEHAASARIQLSCHDLLISLLEKTSIRLLRAEIYDYQDERFYARITTRMRRRKPHICNANPLDAITIATRLRAPIYMSERVIENTAISERVIHSTEYKQQAEPQERDRHELETHLQRAVEFENYEEAARIRDRLHKLR